MRKGKLIDKGEWKNASNGNRYRKITLHELEEDRDRVYPIFEDSDVQEKIAEKNIGDNVKYEVEKEGDFWNITEVYSNDKKQQNDKDISKMFKRKQDYRYKELAWDILKTKQKMYQKTFSSGSEFEDEMKEDIKRLSEELRNM